MASMVAWIWPTGMLGSKTITFDPKAGVAAGAALAVDRALAPKAIAIRSSVRGRTVDRTRNMESPSS
jgi:hypothetical protein